MVILREPTPLDKPRRRITNKRNVLGAMPTLVVGMFSPENACMATQARPWRPLAYS